MAKDMNDSATLELIPAAKKRGRPASGKALTNAERQRIFRQSKKLKHHLELTDDQWVELICVINCAAENNAHYRSCKETLELLRLVYNSRFNDELPAEFSKAFDFTSVTVTENQPEQESVTVTEIEAIEAKPVTVTKKPRAKQVLAQVHPQAEEPVTVTEIPDTTKTVTVTKNNFPARYVHPHECMLTWTGRGRQPVWVKHWLDGGGQLADLEVSAP